MTAAERIFQLFQPIVRKGWSHWLRFLCLLALGFFVGHLLDDSPLLTKARYWLYQRQLMLRDRTHLHPLHTAIVLLRDEDYWGDSFQSRTPLKRGILADMINRLDDLGVNTVALDVDLRSPHPDDPSFEFEDYKAEDARLIAAIQRMCDAGSQQVAHHVVLSSSVTFENDGYHEASSIYKNFLSRLPCVTTGYIQLPYDMRRMPGPLTLANGKSLDSFALAVTKIADRTTYDDAIKDRDTGFRFTEFLTEDDFADKNGQQFLFSGKDLTNPKTLNAVRAGLANKLVFVGANWSALAYGVGGPVDVHESPGGLEPGVMLLANYVEAMLDRTGTFIPLSDSTAEWLEVSLVIVLAIIGVLEIHSGWKWGAFLLACVLSLLLTYLLLQNLGLYLDFLIPLLMMVLHTLGEEVLALRHELKHLRASQSYSKK